MISVDHLSAAGEHRAEPVQGLLKAVEEPQGEVEGAGGGEGGQGHSPSGHLWLGGGEEQDQGDGHWALGSGEGQRREKEPFLQPAEKSEAVGKTDKKPRLEFLSATH